jgi:hypothetical protein
MATVAKVDAFIDEIRYALRSSDLAVADAKAVQMLNECFAIPDVYLSFHMADYALGELRKTDQRFKNFVRRHQAELAGQHAIMYRARASLMWNFDLTHPSLSMGLNGVLATASSLAEGEQCFRNPTLQDQPMFIQAFDATLAQLVQHSKLQEGLADQRTIVVPAWTTLEFLEWLKDPAHKMPLGTSAQQQVHWFFRSAPRGTLLLLPILDTSDPTKSGHYVLAAFWWERAALQGAFFDSVWTAENRYAHEARVFLPLLERLRELYSPGTSDAAVTFKRDKPLSQKGEGCGHICLFFVAYLVETAASVSQPAIRVNALVEYIAKAYDESPSETEKSTVVERLRREWAQIVILDNDEWQKRAAFLAALYASNGSLTASTMQWVEGLDFDERHLTTREAIAFFSLNKDQWLQSTEPAPSQNALGWLPEPAVVATLVHLASAPPSAGAAVTFGTTLLRASIGEITISVPDPTTYWQALAAVAHVTRASLPAALREDLYSDTFHYDEEKEGRLRAAFSKAQTPLTGAQPAVPFASENALSSIWPTEFVFLGEENRVDPLWRPEHWLPPRVPPEALAVLAGLADGWTGRERKAYLRGPDEFRAHLRHHPAEARSWYFAGAALAVRSPSLDETVELVATVLLHLAASYDVPALRQLVRQLPGALDLVGKIRSMAGAILDPRLLWLVLAPESQYLAAEHLNAASTFFDDILQAVENDEPRQDLIQTYGFPTIWQQQVPAIKAWVEARPIPMVTVPEEDASPPPTPALSAEEPDPMVIVPDEDEDEFGPVPSPLAPALPEGMDNVEQAFFNLPLTGLTLVDGSPALRWLQDLDYATYQGSRLGNASELERFRGAYPQHVAFFDEVAAMFERTIDLIDDLSRPRASQNEPSDLDQKRMDIFHRALVLALDSFADNKETNALRNEARRSDALKVLVELLYHLFAQDANSKETIFSARSEQITATARLLIRWEHQLLVLTTRMESDLEKFPKTSRSWFQGEIEKRLTTIREKEIPRVKRLGVEVDLVRRILQETLTQVHGFDDFFLAGTGLVRGTLGGLGSLDAIAAANRERYGLSAATQGKAEKYFRRLGEEPIVLAKEIGADDEEADYVLAFAVVRLRHDFLSNLYEPMQIDLPHGAGALTLTGLQKYLLVVDEDAPQAAADFQERFEEWDLYERSLRYGDLGRFVLRAITNWILSPLSDEKGPIDAVIEKEEILAVVSEALSNDPQRTLAVFEEGRNSLLDQSSGFAAHIKGMIQNLRNLLAPNNWSIDVTAFKAVLKDYNEQVDLLNQQAEQALVKQNTWTTWIAQLTIHASDAPEVVELANQLYVQFTGLGAEWVNQRDWLEQELIFEGLFAMILPRPPPNNLWDLRSLVAMAAPEYARDPGDIEVVDIKHLGAGELQYPLIRFLPAGTEPFGPILTRMRATQARIRAYAFSALDHIPEETGREFLAWKTVRPRWASRREMVEALLARLPFVRPPREDPLTKPETFFAEIDQALKLASDESISQVDVVASLLLLSKDPSRNFQLAPALTALPPGTLLQDPEPKGWLLSAAQVRDAIAFMDSALAQYEQELNRRLVINAALQSQLAALHKARFIEKGRVRVQLPLTVREAALRDQANAVPPLDTLRPVQLGRKVASIKRTLDVPSPALVRIETLASQVPEAAAVLGPPGADPAGTRITLPDLQTRADTLEALSDQTDDDWDEFRKRTGPLTKATFTAYERRAADVAKDLAVFMAPFLAETPLLVTPAGPTPADEAHLAAQVGPLVERLWRASESVTLGVQDVETKLRQLREQYGATTLAAAPALEQHLAWVAAQWTVPAYEDEGSDDPPRPKWRLADAGEANAERSWAAYGGERPGFEDEWLAAVVYNKRNREAAVKAERDRLAPYLRQAEERERFYELFDLSRK